jgi:hypothetical protein
MAIEKMYVIYFMHINQITGCFVIRVNNEFPPSMAAFKASFRLHVECL